MSLDMLPDFLFATFLSKPAWMWALFLGVVIFLMALDLGVLHRTSHQVPMREAVLNSIFYVSLGAAFGFWIYYSLGAELAYEYWTAFVVEKTLALDNLFVISTIFAYFAIPPMYQHRVLIWGIIGVIVLRGIMIGAGVVLIAQFHWILYIFAAFLIFTGVKLLVMQDNDGEFKENSVIRFLRKRLRVTDDIHGQNFFVKLPETEGGRLVWFATPLFIALLMIEFADVLFAVDSIPAVFAITQDPYIVYTSNIFAILGLRALYFMLAALIDRFEHLKYALATLLIFIGSKLFIADAMGWQKFPPNLSLGITFGILGIGIVYSLLQPAKQKAPDNA